mgnify:CR=1 FL=1
MPLDRPLREGFRALVGHPDGRRGRSRIWGPTALILVAGLALLNLPTPAEAQKPRAERPTYSAGEKWIRSDGVYDLIRIEKDLYIFAADGGREIHLTKNLAIAKIVRGGALLFEFEPPPKLGWPLEVGKWGRVEGMVRATESPVKGSFGREPRDGYRGSWAWKVEAYEDVQTAAGTFRAFRISLSHEVTSPTASWSMELQAWYAPEIRQFVKLQAQNLGPLDFHVVAVDRPATAPLQVALADPKDQARVASEGIVAAGKVTSGTGVSRVSVTLNGKEVSKQEEKAPKKEVALNLPLKLQEGKNVLLVTASDLAGNTRQEARTLFYERPPPPVAPTPSLPVVVALPPLQVTISSPRDQARVEQESVALAGLASGGRGVSRA